MAKKKSAKKKKTPQTSKPGAKSNNTALKLRSTKDAFAIAEPSLHVYGKHNSVCLRTEEVILRPITVLHWSCGLTLQKGSFLSGDPTSFCIGDSTMVQ